MCTCTSIFFGVSCAISIPPETRASPLFSLPANESITSASCEKEMLPLSARAATGSPRRLTDPSSMRRLPSTVGACAVPPTAACTRKVPEAWSTSGTRPCKSRPSTLAESRRSSLPREVLPASCAVV